jgi:RNA polymerase sigma-70 factor (ECF subfamily)
MRSRKEETAAFLAGDGRLIADVEKAIRGTVRSFRLGDRDVERDLVQEALARTCEGVGNPRFRNDATIATYARNVARYTTLEFLRRRRREVALDPDTLPAAAQWSAPDGELLSDERDRRNAEAFAALPAECREILSLIYLDGCSYREVASRLSISEPALKSRIHRCRLTCRAASARGDLAERYVFGKVAP